MTCAQIISASASHNDWLLGTPVPARARQHAVSYLAWCLPDEAAAVLLIPSLCQGPQYVLHFRRKGTIPWCCCAGVCASDCMHTLRIVVTQWCQPLSAQCAGIHGSGSGMYDKRAAILLQHHCKAADLWIFDHRNCISAW